MSRRVLVALVALVLPALGAFAAGACASSDDTSTPKKDASPDAPFIGETGAPDADAEPDPGEPCGDRRGLQENAPWPLRGGCPKRAGVVGGPGPQDAKVKWTLQLPLGESSPAVAADGLVWLGTTDGDVVAVTPGGDVAYGIRTGAPVRSSAAIAASGAAVIGGMDGNLYGVLRGTAPLVDGGDAGDDAGDDAGAFRAAKIAFQRKLVAIASSPAIGPDGTIYVGTTDGKLVALSSDGATTKWSATTNDTTGSSPAIALDGTIYVGSSDGKLYAVAPDGKAKWTYDTGAPIKGSPAVGGDESVYVGSSDGKLHAVAPDGKAKWTYATGGPISGTPAVGAAAAYVGSDDKKLHAVSIVTGKAAWTYDTLGAVASPVIGNDGTIYVGSADGHVYAVTKGGTLYFAVNVRGKVVGAPAMSELAILYVTTETSLVAIGQ